MTVDLDVAGNRPALRLLQPPQDLVGDDDGIGARALGEGERDGGRASKRRPPAWRVMVQARLLGSAGADDHVGDILT